MVKVCRVLVIFTLCLCFLAPKVLAQDLQKQLVGKWQGKNKDVMEFFPDGKMVVTDKVMDKELVLTGTYKVLDGQTVSIELKDKEGQAIAVKAKITIKGADLSFTPEGEKAEPYKRLP
jgi:uncharacterized protein (TIGR03066 family)